MSINKAASFLDKNYKKILIPTILVLFLYSVFYGFPDSPSPWLDEGINIGIAKTWVDTGVYSFKLSPDAYVAELPWLITNNYPVLLPVALSFILFGAGLWQVKIVMIMFVTVFLLLTFFFLKSRYSEKSAYMSIALLVSFLPMYGNGLTGANGELPGLTFLLASFFFLNSEKTWKTILAGFLIGICVATKPLFLPILFALAVEELYFAYKGRKPEWKRWLLLFVGMLLPLSIWFKTLFPGDLTVEYLKETFNYYSNSQITSEGTFKTNLLKFFTESTPMHFLILVVFFWFFKIKSKSTKLSREEIIFWIFLVVDIIYFLRSPGWYRYFFPAHIITLVFAGPAFLYCKKYFVGKINIRKMIAFAFVFLFAIQTAHLVKSRGDILYHNKSPRMFAEYLNENIEEDKVLFMVDQAAIGFLVDHEKVYHNYRINSHLRVGKNLFKEFPYPDYIVAIKPEDNELLKNHLTELEDNFGEVHREGKHILYKVKD